MSEVLARQSRRQLRSEETRRRLVSAAIDVVTAHGLRPFSFVKVCEQAGLSRGAVHHHFDAPVDLLGDVVALIHERLFAGVTRDFRNTSGGSLGRAIDVLWSHLRTDQFRVLLEIRAAAATDHELRQAVGDRGYDINRATVEGAVALFGGQVGEPVIRCVLAALTGLALQYFTLTSNKGQADEYAEEFIMQLKELFAHDAAGSAV